MADTSGHPPASFPGRQLKQGP